MTLSETPTISVAAPPLVQAASERPETGHTSGHPSGPADRPAPVLSVRGLRVAYRGRRGTVEAVRGVSFDVLPGQVVALVGESGSGKSTTAHAAVGLLPHTGHVTAGSLDLGADLHDRLDLARLPVRAWQRVRGTRVGLVPQDPGVALNPVVRIGDQVAEVLRIHGRAGRREAAAAAVEILRSVGLDAPEERARQYPHQLSGGMRQRVLIGIALACRPELVIADEPTSALDVTVQRRVLDLLARLTREAGSAVLLITHDLAVAADRADRVVVLQGGEVVEQGPTAQVLRDPQHPYTRELLAAAPLRAVSRAGASARTAAVTDAAGTADGIADRSTTRPAAAPQEAGPAPAEAPARGAERDAIAPVAPDPRPAEGAADVPSVESLRVAERSTPAPVAPDPRVAEGVTDVPPFASLGVAERATPAPSAASLRVAERSATTPAAPDLLTAPDLLVVENLRKDFPLGARGTLRAVDDVSFAVPRGTAFALVGESGSGKSTTARLVLGLERPDGGSVRFDGREVGAARGDVLRTLRRRTQLVHQNPYASLDPRFTVAQVIEEPLRAHRSGSRAQRRERVAELLAAVRLPVELAARRPEELSGGQRQRVAIARALALDPELLVLDEPTSALDVSVQAHVLDLLGQLRAERGLTYLFISHDLAVVRQVADHVGVLSRGRLVETGPVADVFDHPADPYTAELVSAIPGRARAGAEESPVGGIA
ncbi:dipeptide ABC transporter ATP-binding protein [Xylanimonas allomyrinae]|uniref:Dipeptide ABC transporter ATP-binding protein n=1 Tax=Xylanimonas allomyrinae TaxID=2509459 RepID=A0A4V0YEC8_9MICO|nr:ABC transporter ATP-binding protein [Xylanimonas allomyrinae]QAY63761.1 dipeptide ABC transporter ATP-binding protein [Xylanimonas allomyrinae]